MRIHHETSNLFLPGPAGRLEAILWTPARAASPELAAVLCHPHPLFGGTLHNKVIYQTAKTLDALGIPVLRFNFRGAGLSAGRHDRGEGERDDVKTAIDFVAGKFAGTPILLGGFSFGSWVGLRVGCEDARVSELLGLGIPVNKSRLAYLQNCAKPKLFVQGRNDEHGAWSTVEAIVAKVPGENRVVFVEGADHFFSGHLQELDRAISDWLMERHPTLTQN